MFKKLEIPVIQAPMAGGIVTPEMVVKVSNSGLLGMIPGGYLNLDSLNKFVTNVKKDINKDAVFGLNIFIEEYNKNDQYFEKSSNILNFEGKIYNNEYSNKFKFPTNISENQYVKFIIEHDIKVVSTTFGLFTKKSIDELKKHGVDIISTVTNMKEAQMSVDRGIKNIVFQGCEAGGHQATFINNDINETTTIDLVLESNKKFKDINIIAAGGVSIKNMKAFFNAGANYVQMGSVFMMSNLSGLSVSAKSYIRNNFNTVVTNKITGRYARGLKSNLDKLDNPKYKFPIQHYHTSFLRKVAKEKEIFKYTSLWVGDNSDNIFEYNLDNLIDEIKKVIKT
jgi:nitronate monooxygenase